MNPRFNHWLFDKEQSSLRDFFDHLKNGLAVGVACLSLPHIPATILMAQGVVYLSAIGCGLLVVLWILQFLTLIDKAPIPIPKGHQAFKYLAASLFSVFYIAIFFAIGTSFLVALKGLR